MKLTISSGSVPAGSYVAAFKGVEPVKNEYGDGLSWRWEVTKGPLAGQSAGRTTNNRLSPKTNGGRILAGLHGKPVSPGEQVDTDAFVGKEYLIVVIDCPSGGTRVESVTIAP